MGRRGFTKWIRGKHRTSMAMAQTRRLVAKPWASRRVVRRKGKMTPDWGFVSIGGQKRRWGAYCSDSCPHYSKREAFFVYEPFVEVEHRWCIEETPADCVQAPLCENEVADLSGEARCDERCNNNDETENRR